MKVSLENWVLTHFVFVIPNLSHFIDLSKVERFFRAIFVGFAGRLTPCLLRSPQTVISNFYPRWNLMYVHAIVFFCLFEWKLIHKMKETTLDSLWLIYETMKIKGAWIKNVKEVIVLRTRFTASLKFSVAQQMTNRMGVAKIRLCISISFRCSSVVWKYRV